MVSKFLQLRDNIRFRDTDTYIGYLPLAHILELDAELTSLCYGCKVRTLGNPVEQIVIPPQPVADSAGAVHDGRGSARPLLCELLRAA